MDAHAAAGARAAEGWAVLRAFFTEGSRHLAPAVAAFEGAEQLLRRSGAGRAGGGAEDVDAVLIGLSIALRLRRGEGDLRRAVVLAQQLVNVARRRSGEAAALPLRAYLEDAYRDFADHAQGDEAARAAEDGIEACDRTLALARRFRTDDGVAHARATKALLLRRLAVLRPGSDAPARLREADRLAAAALASWPARDPAGLAAFQADLAAALVAGERPRPSAVDRAEALLRHAERVAPAGDRYLAAKWAAARARVALAAGRPEALDAVTAASGAFRALGLDREAEEVERWL
ncbi:MAG TPA: hypothetical protein VKW09_07470 [bacterium]|nr:hypothetical protein [bacterium]